MPGYIQQGFFVRIQAAGFLHTQCCQFVQIARLRNVILIVQQEFIQNIPVNAFRKQGRILRTAKYYLLENGLSEDTPCRFDVIGMADG